MDKYELAKVLCQHQMWVEDAGGKRAILIGADLREANLTGADLGEAILRKADLSGASLFNARLFYADLRVANLCGADLRNANLFCANLRGANLRGANLSGAYLYGADLRGADLHGADLRGADLCSANLCGADLCDAKLDDVKYDHRTSFFVLQCPEEGSFIGYKKACNHIIKLEILPDAKRSSATTRKCRCSSAKVLSITTLDGQDDGTQTVSSDYDNSFVYRVGEIVRVDNFDDNRWRECSRGIHFFMTRDEAVRYS